jgi:hypothetical protein
MSQYFAAHTHVPEFPEMVGGAGDRAEARVAAVV